MVNSKFKEVNKRSVFVVVKAKENFIKMTGTVLLQALCYFPTSIQFCYNVWKLLALWNEIDLKKSVTLDFLQGTTEFLFSKVDNKEDVSTQVLRTHLRFAISLKEIISKIHRDKWFEFARRKTRKSNQFFEHISLSHVYSVPLIVFNLR
mgnify:CR=1 FL=1